MNTLMPPAPPIRIGPSRHGRAVFERAGCAGCHAGPTLTNHRVIPAGEIGTQPSRAAALGFARGDFRKEPELYTFDTPVPLPPDPARFPLPVPDLDQLRLAWGQTGGGGYKVPGLVGLYWRAPYLHDGGVAVGRRPDTELGLPGTVLRGIPADPVNSLRALLDASLRQAVIAANQAAELEQVGVGGAGHAFWVDEASGYSVEDQDALIGYLLSVPTPPQ